MNFSSGQHPSSCLRRTTLLLGIALLFGAYWNLGWPFALAIKGLVFPVVMPIIIASLCKRVSGLGVYGLYVAAVMISMAMSAALYVAFGGGLQYMLHDGETQLVYGVILGEQTLLGAVTAGVLMWLRAHRKNELPS